MLMKLLFATSSFQGGGITSYAIEVIKHYSADNEVYVFIGDDSQSPINGDNITIIKCESNDISIQNALFAIHEINEVIKPDVVLNSNSKLISFVTPFLLDTIRVVTVSHSLRYMETTVSAITHRYTDSVIALSNYNKQYIARRFNVRDRDKIKVVYNFVSEGNKVENLIKEKKAAKRLNIVFMGGTSGAKTPELALVVLKKLLNSNLDFHFYWLGTTTPTLQKLQPFKSISDLLPDDERLTITGRIPREEAEAISRMANIILIPSRREGCPMALLETMRYGVISVTADYKNACRELIKDNYNGFVLPHRNADRFYEVITELINNHSKYLDYYDNSLETYYSELSFPVWGKSMDNIIYSEKLNHKKRKTSFSKRHYNYLKYKFKLINWFDSIHKNLFETLPSATVFFFEYLKRK